MIRIESAADQNQNQILFIIFDNMQKTTKNDSQIFQSDQQDIESVQLHQRITIKQIDLHNLINDRQRFMQTIANLLDQAKGKIDLNEKQQLKFALVYLKQSERVLEYAASCGKNINKELIINILHNQASIYQKLWDLNDCSNYLEGIIYNYDQFIRESSCQSSAINQELYHMQLDPSMGRMKQRLARYNLQFCAVNSQLEDHDSALMAVKKAYALMCECVKSSLNQITKYFKTQTFAPEDWNMKLSLLLGLASFDKRFEEKLDIFELNKNILKSAHFSLQIWEQRKRSRKEVSPSKDAEFAEYLNSYSIGNIVEIVPLNCGSSQIGLLSVLDKFDKHDKEDHIFNKIIMLSASFFSRATELRLKSLELFKKNIEQRKYSRQYKMSINYHLLAIITVATFVSYEVKYLNQILLSYEKHYKSNLQEYKTVETENISKIIELLNIEVIEYSTLVETEILLTKESPYQHSFENRNDYNLKINFETDKFKKLEKMRSLKKITKELTEPNKKYEEKDMKLVNKSKQNKTSFSISKYDKKERNQSKNDTLKKPSASKDIKDKPNLNQKLIHKVKSKKNQNQMSKSRHKQEKTRTKQIVDQTEELFFCFTKKTKKTQGKASPSSQIRTPSIGSTPRKSSSKKYILSPKIKTTQNNIRNPKSPPKRKNISQNYYF